MAAQTSLWCSGTRRQAGLWLDVVHINIMNNVQRQLTGHRDRVNAAVFSSSGMTAVRHVHVFPVAHLQISASADHTIKIWDVKTANVKDTILTGSTCVDVVNGVPECVASMCSCTDTWQTVSELTYGQESASLGHTKASRTQRSDRHRPLLSNHVPCFQLWYWLCA